MNGNIINDNIIQMSGSILKEYRESKVLELGHVCPICNIERKTEEFVVDHQHKTKSEKNGIDGAGMVRGVICFMCNSTEGRLLAKFKRSGLANDITFQYFLRALASYLDQPVTEFIHPNEKSKEKRLMKRTFNKIKKIHDEKYQKRKPLEYPKSGKATKLIRELSEEHGIEL